MTLLRLERPEGSTVLELERYGDGSVEVAERNIARVAVRIEPHELGALIEALEQARGARGDQG